MITLYIPIIPKPSACIYPEHYALYELASECCGAEASNNQIYEVLPKYENDKRNRKSTRQKDLRGSPQIQMGYIHGQRRRGNSTITK